MRVGAVGNRVLCGSPSPCGRVLCVHRDGSVHTLRWDLKPTDERRERTWAPVNRRKPSTLKHDHQRSRTCAALSVTMTVMSTGVV